MLKKLTLVLVLLGLYCNVSFADYTGVSSISSSVFNSTPVMVFDGTTTADAAFNADFGGVFYSPGTTNDTVYVWMITWVDANTALTIVKRTLYAENLTANGSDVTYTTSIKTKLQPHGIPGIGYIGFYTVENDGTADQLNFYVLAANASASTSPTKLKLTSNTVATNTFTVLQSQCWYQDDYFYIVYTKTTYDTLKDLEVLFQGIAAANGTARWSSSLSIVTLTNNDIATTFAIGGPDNATNSGSAYIVWKDTSANILYQAKVNLTAGTVGAATALKTDTATITYSPGGVISSYNTYGAVYYSKDTTSGTDVYTWYARYNDTEASTMTLPLTSTSSAYTPAVVFSFNHNAGFLVVALHGGTDDNSYVMRSFYSNGTANTTQATIGTTGGGVVGLFQDANGALWAGYYNFDGSTYKAKQGYLGKLVGQLNPNVANLVAPFFTLLTLIVFGLFIF